jgi:hypothetical protein
MGDTRLDQHLTNQMRAASLLINEITRRREGRVQGKYPRAEPEGKHRVSFSGMHEGGVFQAHFVMFYLARHTWQGGVLERIERHLAFLRQRLLRCCLDLFVFQLANDDIKHYGSRFVLGVS